MSVNPTKELLAPFRLEPRFVERIWGSTTLSPWFDYGSEEKPVGEVWLTGDACLVQTGELAGKTLADVFREHSAQMLGSAAPESARGMSPLLMKVIFAEEKLSVQVHPDDTLAQKIGQPRGKTECWYALDAKAGARVACGLKSGTTLESIDQGVREGTLEDQLEVLPVSTGDMIYVSAGTVHAIWPGAVLLETQQNSDTTYRLYDYGRPRELHVAQAIEATRLVTDAGKVEAEELLDRIILIERSYFCVESMQVDGVRSGDSMAGNYERARGLHAGPSYLFAAAGSGRLDPIDDQSFEPVDLPERGMVAVPAYTHPWQLRAGRGLRLIRISPRWPDPAQP